MLEIIIRLINHQERFSYLYFVWQYAGGKSYSASGNTIMFYDALNKNVN